ncbi:MAG: flagellar type III secretion system protein FlhB [Pseudomonadota bacterium]
MAEQENDTGEKEFDATEQKRDQARQDGNVAQSKEMNGLSIIVGVLVAATMLRGPVGDSLFEQLAGLMSNADAFAQDMETNSGRGLSARIPGFVLVVLPLLGTVVVAVLTSLLVQQAFSFSLKKIAPDVNKISPIRNLKNKYGTKGMIEFAKDTAKMLVAGLIAATYLLIFAQNNYAASFGSAGGSILELTFKSSFNLVVCFCIFQVVLAAIDVPIQWQQHAKELKMSREEIKKQMKESEGDPHLKQSRREKGAKISRGEMLNAVKTSTVVMVNPTHYAVALRWDPDSASAPICVAKGADHLAATIRTIAIENQVPVYSDPPAARSIYAAIDVNEEIRPEHFAAVAAAIQYVDRVRGNLRDA